jgi:hypothetical protein
MARQSKVTIVGRGPNATMADHFARSLVAAVDREPTASAALERNAS